MPGIPQKLDELLDVLFGFIDAGDVGKRGLDLVLRQQPCLALAERHGPAAAAAAALHLPHEQHEHRDDDQNGKAGDQKLSPDALLLGQLASDLDVVVVKVVGQLGIGQPRRPDDLELLTRLLDAANQLVADGHGADLVVTHLLDEFGVGEGLRLRLDVEVIEHSEQHGRDDQPEQQIFSHIRQGLTLLLPAPGATRGPDRDFRSLHGSRRGRTAAAARRAGRMRAARGAAPMRAHSRPA